MAAKRHERTRARRAALQILYTSEITEKSPTAIAEEDGGGRLVEDGPLPAYALSLVRGLEAHRCAIDDHLAATSENWSLARMPIVDRSILRLAAYEMMFVDDVPVSVAINEAVELAKDFGGEDESPRFVNGVLGRIAKRLDDAAAADAGLAGGACAEASPVPGTADPEAAPAGEEGAALEAASPAESGGRAVPVEAAEPAEGPAPAAEAVSAESASEGGESRDA